MSTFTVTAKACTHCGVTKALTSFGPHRGTRDGRQSWCKACRADYIRQRRETEPDLAARSREQIAAYRAAEARVREAHRDEFERYYADELAMRGLA